MEPHILGTERPLRAERMRRASPKTECENLPGGDPCGVVRRAHAGPYSQTLSHLLTFGEHYLDEGAKYVVKLGRDADIEREEHAIPHVFQRLDLVTGNIRMI